MADTVTLNAGSGGSVIATDDVSGSHYQRVKVVQGADGVNSGDTSVALPFPVQAFPPITHVTIGTAAAPVATVSGAIATSSGTTHTLVAAGTNRIYALGLYVQASGATTIKFTSGTSGTDLTGAFSLLAAATGGLIVTLTAPPGGYLFRTAAATLLSATTSASVTLAGFIVYCDAA